MLVLAALSLVGFLYYESRRHDPFIDLRFFRSIPFASATVIAVCAFAAYGAFLFMMSLYLQGYRGYLGDAHRPALSTVGHRCGHLLPAVGPVGRSVTVRDRHWSPPAS